MQEFILRGAQPLDRCLKMLFSKSIPFHVRLFQDEKERIVYRVIISVSEQKFNELIELYKTLIYY